MLYVVHWVWGQLPSFMIKSVSITWWCTKWTQRLVWIVTHPLHLSTRQQIMHSVFGKKNGLWWTSFGGGGCPALVPLTHAVLFLTMRLKIPCLQLHLAIRTSNPLHQPILIRWPLPGHFGCVHLHRHAAIGLSQLVNHADHFLDIRPQDDMVKYFCDGIEIPL